MRSAARFITRRSDPARRWARWLLVLLLPWLLSGMGQSALHSANCPDVLALHHAAPSHNAGHHASATSGQTSLAQTLVPAALGSDDLCLTSLWATQTIGMQVAAVPLTLSARVTTPLLPPIFLVSGIALPRSGLIRGPPFA